MSGSGARLCVLCCATCFGVSAIDPEAVGRWMATVLAEGLDVPSLLAEPACDQAGTRGREHYVIVATSATHV